MKQSSTITAQTGLALAGPSNTRFQPTAGKLGNDRAFMNYSYQFNKNLITTHEFERHQQKYHTNDQYIRETNAIADRKVGNSLHVKHNLFSDMDSEDYAKHIGLIQQEAAPEARTLPS